MEKQIIE